MGRTQKGYAAKDIFFRFSILAFILLLSGIYGNLALALQPPTAEQLEKYKNDGTLAARIAQARALKNHQASNQIVARAKYNLQRLSLQMEGKDSSQVLAPPPAWKGMPTKGSIKVLALLIAFNDYPESNTKESIAAKLFDDGDGSAAFPYESLRNYYRRSSYNQLEIQGNVLGWYPAPYSRSSVIQTDAGRESLIKEALNYYQAQGHDFTQYDNDGDGEIDYFMVIWTGPPGAWASFWWGFKLNFSDSTYQLDGKKLDAYSWQWEANDYPGVFNPVTVIHETGHALGLPDYYDYNPAVGPKGGLGGLDMMDSTRGDHNCFSKFLLDWITPTTFNSGTHTVDLNPSGVAEDAVLVMPNITSGNHFAEFFMIQNRFRMGNDNDISYPNDGLLIWHVDARLNSGGYNFSYDNSYTEHKLIRLMEADGLEEIETGDGFVDAGDYYVEGKNFSSVTTPNSDRYDGSPTGISVQSIVASGNVMSLEVSLPLACAEAIPIERKIVYNDTTVGAASNIKQYACNLDWDKSGPEKVYQVTTTIAGELSATLSNLTADLDVFILNSCDPASCVAYGDSQAVYPNAPPGTYYIVVDGSKNVSGSFTLIVDYPSAGLACEEAVTLGRNVPYNGTTVGGPTKVKDYGCAPGWSESGPERIHKIVTTGYGDIVADLSNMTADLDVFILDACDPYRCVGHGANSALYPDAPPGTYYIVVDGYEGASGSYTLTVDYGPPEMNCDAAIPMVRFVPYDGTTFGAPDKIRRYGCAWGLNESGPERVHRITTTISGDITATLSNLTNDLDVFILSACDAASCAANGDNSATYTNAPPGTYYIVVDGYFGGVGDYTLNVSSAVPPPIIQLGSSDLIVQENGGSISVTVNLNKVFDLPVSVDYATIGETATAGTDFTPISGTLTFALGETSKTLILPIINDALWEPANETFRLTLSNPVNGVLGTPNQAVVTIVDNDEPPTVQVNAPTYTVQENAGPASITVTLSHPSEGQVTVGYATSDGTALKSSDYTETKGTLIFTPGQTSKPITVPIIDDAIDEPDETFNVVLSNPVNAVLGTPSQAVLTIVDNDPPPTVQFSSATYTVNENAGWATITVALSVASGYEVRVNYATSNGTAAAGSDYLTASGTLTFAPGETSKTFAVAVIDNQRYDPNKTVNLALNNPVNAFLGSPLQATLIILEDDPPPTIADMNGDRKAEVLWHNQVTGNVVAWSLENGKIRTAQFIKNVNDLNWKIVGTGDFDGDRNPDILWHNRSTGAVYVWYMNGANYLYDQHIRTVEDTNWKVVGVGDFNRDGRPDILWQNEATGAVYVWYMSGPAYVYDQQIWTVPDLNWKVVGVGDCNGDGSPDIYWHNQVTGAIYVWYMSGPAYLYDQHIRTVPDLNWKINNIDDYSGDGKPDILWKNQVTGQLYLWNMDGATFVSDQPLQGSSGSRGIVDFDWDGNPDILWQNQATGQVYVWYMNGGAFIADQHIRTVPDTNWKIEGMGDFNGDGNADILWRHQVTGDVYLWYMSGAGFMGDQFIRRVEDINWKIEGVGDFNGDGQMDILWRHQATGDVYVWYMNGAGFVSDQFIRRVDDPNWRIVGAADFNGDGQPDILWQNQATGAVYAWYMNATTFLSDRHIQTVSDTNWKIEGIADFNGDGSPDILWRHQVTGDVYIWSMNGAAFLYDQFIRRVGDTSWRIVN